MLFLTAAERRRWSEEAQRRRGRGQVVSGDQRRVSSVKYQVTGVTSQVHTAHALPSHAHTRHTQAYRNTEMSVMHTDRREAHAQIAHTGLTGLRTVRLVAGGREDGDTRGARRCFLAEHAVQVKCARPGMQ